MHDLQARATLSRAAHEGWRAARSADLSFESQAAWFFEVRESMIFSPTPRTVRNSLLGAAKIALGSLPNLSSKLR